MNELVSWFTGTLPDLPERENAQLGRMTRWFRARMSKWLTGTLAVLTLTVWIAMAEVDRLIADTATETGRSASASSLQAIDPRLGQENWAVWHSLPFSSDLAAGEAIQGTPAIGDQVASLLAIYFIADVFFAALYTGLLLRLLWRRRWVRFLVFVVLASELAESLIQLSTLHQVLVTPASEPLTVQGLLAVALVATTLKWAFLAGLVVVTFAYPRLRRSFFRLVKRTWRALFIHRISLVAILLIAALALLPIEGVNDQLPDTQRAWIGAGILPFLVTSCIVLVVVFGIFFVGRRRSELIWKIFHVPRDLTSRNPGSIPDKKPHYELWMVLPLLLAVGFIVVALLTPGHKYWSVDAPFIAVLLVPTLAVVVSLAIEKRLGEASTPQYENPDYFRAWDAWRCGDVLAMVFLAISGISLVRSFTAPLALHLAQGQAMNDEIGVAWAFWIVGVLTAALAFPIGALLNRMAWGKFMDPRAWAGPEVASGSVVLFVFFTTVLALFAVLPVQASGLVGVPGTAALLVGAWAVVIGLLVVSLQGQKPLRLFASMKLRANPVLTLIAVTLLAGTAFGGTTNLHNLRPSPKVAEGTNSVKQRLTVESSLGEWLKNKSACTKAIDGSGLSDADARTAQDLRVRPMILVAAEGGGIRAASWTVRAFEKLSPVDSCANGSVILSSGVSGGSLGLTLSRLYGVDAVGKMKELAQSGPLAAAVTGALVGDIVGASTGLKIPTKFNDPATGQELLAWNDRAGLVESVWEQSAGKLAYPFGADQAGPTGALLLNSTDTGTGCRVVISQLDLPAPVTTTGAPPQGIQCTAQQGFPLSVDLLDQEAQCALKLRWSTATLLSGRFPIVSPGGRAAAAVADGKGGVKCPMDPGFQLIDGGYSEVSAMGTVADLWPVLQKAVLAHNACVVAIATMPKEDPKKEVDGCTETVAKTEIVVPVFLFLQNSPGSDIVARAPKAAAELMVPLIGKGAKELQSGAPAWIQRLEASASVCPDSQAASICSVAAKSVAEALGNRSVVEVAPNSVPALAAPLGWSLSDMSQLQLEKAMAAEADTAKGRDMEPFARLLDYLRK
ncbi:hypothetical protein ACX80E_13125 [Arthrobacter sp. TMN-49]